MTEITPQPGIMDIALYQGGASHIAGRTDVLKLSSNENPWGPSPAAMAAVRAATADLHRYPSTDHATLRAAIAEVRGLPADQIICGCGSDEVLSWLCYAYAGPGDEVLYTEHGFGLYRICALAAGATPVIAPETERRVDVDHLLAAITPRTRLIFIANPGNPTGTMLSEAELTRLADGVPPQVMLVLDGAYAEFAPGYDGGAALIAARDNVVMTRTFSKLYGLGGLRIGWGYGPRAVIDVLNRIRGPFNLSGLQLAAAEAAIRDRDFAERCVNDTVRLRAALVAGLAELGVAADPSQANFVMARFGSVSEADAAEAQLLAQGIIVRRPKSYGFPAALRITVPTEPDLHRFLTALAGFREAAA